MRTKSKLSVLTPVALLAVLLAANLAASANAPAPAAGTATPIQHLVVIFDENTSFDHYFATYPNAANPPNEPQFTAAPGTPPVTGLSGAMLTDNPNAVAAGNANYNPTRLDRTEPVTCDNTNHYLSEQQAYNNGLLNEFPTDTGCANGVGTYGKSIVMDYYDGNTVTALWNYAQNFALNDNAFGTTFGPSTIGALNVVSGLAGPAVAYTTTSVPNDTATLPVPGATSSTNVKGDLVNGQLIANLDPTYDDCSYSGQPDSSTQTAAFSPGVLNVGNLLNSAGITWGWFEGGFAPTVPYNPATGAPAQCGESEAEVGGTIGAAYSTHYDPFQYFASTANPHHLPPSSPSMIGYTDQANHQYDISDFWIAADSGNLPAVSYLKASVYQTGHPATSDPLDEQAWLVNVINKLMSLPTWSTTAVIINWDDSDGWYDSVMPPIVNPSDDPANDALNGPGVCGATPTTVVTTTSTTGSITTTATSTSTALPPLGVEDRCGYGPRIPILVISPYAQSNFVDNTIATQTAIVSFIEYNWNLAATTPGLLGPQSYDTLAGSILNMFNFQSPASGNRVLFLNPSTGEPAQGAPGNLGQDSGPNNGIPNTTTSSTCTDVDSNPDVCATENTFFNNLIPANDYVWFSAVADITNRESSVANTVYFTGQWINVQLQGGNGIPLRISAPNAEVVFTPSASTVTTTYTGGMWVTTAPVGYSGNVFIGGVAYQVPTGVSLAGAQVDWTGVFSGATISFTLQWQWAAAVYSQFTTNYGALDVTAIRSGDINAGTPLDYISDFVALASGQDGPSGPALYTGGYSQPGNAYYQAYLLNQ